MEIALRRVVVSLVFILVVSCSREADEKGQAPTAAAPTVASRESAIVFPEGLDATIVTELLPDYHAFREAKLAVCPKDLGKAMSGDYPVVAELQKRNLVEEPDPEVQPQELRLTLAALSQLVGWTEDEDAYYLPLADRAVVSIDRVETEDSYATVRFKWKYVPRELGTSIVRGDPMSGEVRLVDEGERWRIFEAAGLHAHLYNEHDRVATNQAELTHE